MKVFRHALPIAVALVVFAFGMIWTWGPWRPAPDAPDFKFESLTFLAVLLALLAYVAVAEEKLIAKVQKPSLSLEYFRRAGNYLALVVGDFFLIALSIDMLRLVMPPSLADIGTAYESRVVMIVWGLAIGFGSLHIYNWTRGLLHLILGPPDKA